MTDPTTSRAAGKAPHRATAILLQVVKWVLFAAVLVFAGREIHLRSARVDWDTLRFDITLMVLAALSILAAKALTFLMYGLLLRRFGASPGWLPVMASFWTAQIAKYVPGKVGSVVGIVLALRRFGVAGQTALGAIIMVDGASVALGLAVTIPLSLWAPVHERFPTVWLWCTLALAASLVCLHPRILAAAANPILRRAGYQPVTIPFRYRHYLGPVLVQVLPCGFLGLGCWLLAGSMKPVPASALPIVCCAVVTVTIAGFLAFFAPAGLGVQESLLLVLLSPLIGGGLAAIVAVLMRLFQVLAEALLAAAGLVMVWRLAPRPQ